MTHATHPQNSHTFNIQTRTPDIYDCLIIGGSFAGLSAALQLARGQRQVLILDAGETRNRFAEASHGFFTLDGVSPAEVRQRALEPLLAYPTVSLRQTRVTAARKSEEGFVLQSDDGQEVKGRTLILATGVADQLPDIPGLKERWGKTVIHCPYCHGYELRGQPIAVLAGSAHSAMQAAMLPDWGPTTYFTQGDFEPDDDLLPVLTRRGVTIERIPIVAIEGEGGGEGDAVSAVRLAAGRRIAVCAVDVAPQTQIAQSLVEQLGLATEEAPTGQMISADAMRQTSVPGVFAAGDSAMPMHNATLASASGVMAGVGAHRYLIFNG